MTLWDRSIQKGARVYVVGFSQQGLYQERLHEMGIRVGTEIKVLGRMPFGGPLLIRHHATFLALRQQEALCAQVSLQV